MLTTPLAKAIRTTSSHLKRLKELRIATIGDFLGYFPYRYTDGREVRRIIDVQINAQNTIRGAVISINSKNSFRRRMKIVTALISDESGSIEAIWFNQGYLERTLHKGMRIMLSGKVKYDTKKGRLFFSNPLLEIIRPEQIHTARIVPIYHETELNAVRRRPGKISSKWIREKLFPLMPFAEGFPEYLPPEIRKKHDFISYSQAIKNIHFPSSEKELNAGKRRLAFDELFLLQLAALHRRYIWRKTAAESGRRITQNWELIKNFTGSLPWKLTDCQKKAVYEIINDLARPFPMSRLLEGDTGSGKTVVAASAALHVIKSGWQACLLAPTEILARQHLKTLIKLLKPFDISPILLVGSTPDSEKRKIIEGLKNGKIQFVVGTHALIQERIGFNKLGLAIIDEQHRFGVRQREILKTYGSPHILSLTATPIPRTLALILYGDQELSVLDEMPPGRQKIITRVVPEEKRADAYKWIKNEIEKGRQAFIIFPLIEESPDLEIKAAVQEFEKLQSEIFPHLKVGLLHGQMKSIDKDEIMNGFTKNEIQILVSTAVVEVGVDVPNATIMMIEGAERFGLAQLHQFRGRVGRGSEKSYCFLFPTLQIPQIMSRLNSLVKHDSGFALAEIDLALRGPGEVYGTAQSGIPDLKMANLSDSLVIKQSRDAANEIIENDPELIKYPQLQQKLAEQENIAIDY